MAAGGLLVVLSVMLVASPVVQHGAAANISAREQKVVHYVRERFGIPSTTTLTIEPFQDSEFNDFYKTTIYVHDGQKKSGQPVFLTKDGNYMVIGDVFPSSQAAQKAGAANASETDKEIVDYVRTKFHVPPTVKLSVGPFQDSRYQDFYKITIYGEAGARKSAQPAFVTKDGRYTVIGSIFNLNADPRKEVEQTINLQNQPTYGPADARVTIVEFADLECPTCAATEKFINHDLIPKYGQKIRIVFKEFPLVAIHNWALRAAIANECGYQLNPANYLRYRSIIFDSQDMIDQDAANVRSLLLDMGQRAGYNRLKLSECMDSKASLPRVEADMHEGQALGIMSTPTLFINGTPVVGLNPPRIYQLINKGLQQGTSK